MTTYADYTFYTESYMGTVREEEFPRLAARASSFLDYYTQNRAKDHADMVPVKLCCCALVDNYQVIEAAQELAAKRLSGALETDAEVKSETVGGYSRTLDTGASSALAALNTTDGARKLLAETCRVYLAHTGLLYRGGHGCTRPT